MKQTKLPMQENTDTKKEPVNTNDFSDIVKMVCECLQEKIVTKEQLGVFLKKKQRKYN